MNTSESYVYGSESRWHTAEEDAKQKKNGAKEDPSSTRDSSSNMSQKAGKKATVEMGNAKSTLSKQEEPINEEEINSDIALGDIRNISADESEYQEIAAVSEGGRDEELEIRKETTGRRVKRNDRNSEGQGAEIRPNVSTATGAVARNTKSKGAPRSWVPSSSAALSPGATAISGGRRDKRDRVREIKNKAVAEKTDKTNLTVLEPPADMPSIRQPLASRVKSAAPRIRAVESESVAAGFEYNLPQNVDLSQPAFSSDFSSLVIDGSSDPNQALSLRGVDTQSSDSTLVSHGDRQISSALQANPPLDKKISMDLEEVNMLLGPYSYDDSARSK